MKPEVKAYYIDENADLADIEDKIANGWAVVPTGNERLFVLAKVPEKKIVTPKAK